MTIALRERQLEIGRTNATLVEKNATSKPR